MSLHMCTASYQSESKALWIQKRWPRQFVWINSSANHQKRLLHYFAFLCHYPSSLTIPGSSLQLVQELDFFLSISLSPLSLLSCHMEYNLPKLFPYLFQIKGQCVQLQGSRSKYLLGWNRGSRQYFVYANIHLAWLSFSLSNRRMNKWTQLLFINTTILEPFTFWSI